MNWARVSYPQTNAQHSRQLVDRAKTDTIRNTKHPEDSNMIQLNLSAEQFDLLIKIFSIGKFILELNAEDSKEELFQENYLEQYILSHSANDSVSFSELNKKFCLTEELLNKYFDILNEHDTRTLVKHLIFRLATRDLENEVGIDFQYLSRQERIDGTLKYSVKYEKEFLINGVKNLIVNGLFETQK